MGFDARYSLHTALNYQVKTCMIHSFNNRINDVKWDGEKIVVMGDVFIDPPYEEHSCHGNEKSLAHITKIVSM